MYNKEISHADLCIKAAKIAAPEAEIILINAGEGKTGVLNEKSLDKALELCKSLTPNIIAMCFSMSSISYGTKNSIYSLIKSGVIICASVDPVLFNSYPQNIDEVISVDVQNEHHNFKEDIVCVNDIFYINHNVYRNLTEYNSSSFATGYFAGFLAKVLEFNPLITSKSLMTYYRYQSSTKAVSYDKKKPTAYYLVAGQHDIDMYYEMISSNYLYYYDEKCNCFKERNSHKPVGIELIKEVDVICGDDFLIERPTIPNLTENIHLNYHSNLFKSNDKPIEPCPYSLQPISIPSICIGSYGMNMEKLSIQLYLNYHLTRMSYKLGNISFNPIAHLFGYKYIQYPEAIRYHQYWYDLSYYLYHETKNNNLLITSMAGNFDRFIDYGHRMGDTSHIIMNIHEPDIVILCLSDFIEISEIIRAINYIVKGIGAKAIIYVSNRSREDIMYTSSNYNIRLTEMSIEAYCKEIKLITKTTAFYKKDLEDDSLARQIIKLLS